jgi:hypothetical protein
VQQSVGKLFAWVIARLKLLHDCEPLLAHRGEGMQKRSSWRWARRLSRCVWHLTFNKITPPLLLLLPPRRRHVADERAHDSRLGRSRTHREASERVALSRQINQGTAQILSATYVIIFGRVSQVHFCLRTQIRLAGCAFSPPAGQPTRITAFLVKTPSFSSTRFFFATPLPSE